jgi:hypothetical protein
MKRDKSHEEQIERWARFVKEHPGDWKSKVKPLIDSQIKMSQRFYKSLMKTPEGKEKIKKLRKIEN